MKPFTVLIPTANQPAFLETALQSVARQTAERDIEEVVVSENLRNRASEKVCAKFPRLPITYVFQESPLTLVEHFMFLFRHAKTDLVAFLCDDDWWAPGHLQTGFQALTHHPKAAAYFSACFYAQSERANTGWIQRTTVLWLAAGKPGFATEWDLGRKEVLAANGLLSAFHFSTMVARREALCRAAAQAQSDHAYQLDRSVPVALSNEGRILYEPLLDTFIRWHGDNYSKRLSVQERERMFRDYTERIWQLATLESLDLTLEWQRYLAHAPTDVLDEVGKAFRRAMPLEGLTERGFGQFILPPAPVRATQRAMHLFKRKLLQMGLAKARASAHDA